MSKREIDVPVDFRPERNRRLEEITSRIRAHENHSLREKGSRVAEDPDRASIRKRGKRREVVCISMWNEAAQGYPIFSCTLQAERETGAPHQLISRALDRAGMHAGRKSWRSIALIPGAVVELNGKKYLRPAPPNFMNWVSPSGRWPADQLAFGQVFRGWPTPAELPTGRRQVQKQGASLRIHRPCEHDASQMFMFKAA